MSELIIYSKVEVQAMLAAPKCLGTVDWETPEWQLACVRDTAGERSEKFKAFAEDIALEMFFTIEPRFSATSNAFSITLSGRMSDRLWQSLCRYDIHPSPHMNKSFCEGGEILIPAGAIHRHVYSEEAIRKTGIWHKCAELLFMPYDVPSLERRDQVKRSFLEGLKVKLVDKGAFRAFMEFDTE